MSEDDKEQNMQFQRGHIRKLATELRETKEGTDTRKCSTLFLSFRPSTAQGSVLLTAAHVPPQLGRPAIPVVAAAASPTEAAVPAHRQEPPDYACGYMPAAAQLSTAAWAIESLKI